jgi:hypothetical protein
MKTFLALVPVLVCACSKGNKLDSFEDDITMHTTSGGNSQDMIVEVKKDQLRFDMSEVCIAQGIAFFDIGSLRGGGPKSGSAIATQFREKKSFPLRSVEYDATGKEQSRMEVTKIEPAMIDDSRFAAPADYTKLSLPVK